MSNIKYRWAVQYENNVLKGICDSITITSVSNFEWETAEEYIEKAQFKPEDNIIAIFKIIKHEIIN